jgi:hypothetical protein
MTNIPFEQQRLAVNPIEHIQWEIMQGNAISGDELLDAIERSLNHRLEGRLRDVVSKCSVSAVKRRGRPSNCKGREDFALAELDALYPALLQKYEEKAQQSRRLAAVEGDVLARAKRTPGELAYVEILQSMKSDFPNIDWLALRNKHSAWKNDHFQSPENCVDSEDIYAEIDQQFPKPTDS